LVSPLSSKDDNGSGFGSSSEIRLHAFSDAEVTIDSKTEEKHMQGSMHLQYMSHDEVEGEKNSSAYTCSLSPVNVPPAGSPRIVGAFCSVPSV
jgi:hypothetical protein